MLCLFELAWLDFHALVLLDDLWSIGDEEKIPTLVGESVVSEHAVATASAQNDNGSLEAKSIVRAASTRVRFRLSTRRYVSVFEEWMSTNEWDECTIARELGGRWNYWTNWILRI
ncbi:hypothetical protein Tco_0155755 [Tanacetum coccineum]